MFGRDSQTPPASRDTRESLTSKTHPLLRCLAVIWASPNSLFGLLWGCVARIAGGSIRVVEGVIEIEGRGVAWVFDTLNRRQRIAAITFGHVVLGRDSGSLDRTRRHERVHVAQYCRWGPLFIPAYLLSSAWLWLRGRDAYRDNPFEVEAFAVDDCSSPSPCRHDV